MGLWFSGPSIHVEPKECSDQKLFDESSASWKVGGPPNQIVSNDPHSNITCGRKVSIFDMLIGHKYD